MPRTSATTGCRDGKRTEIFDRAGAEQRVLVSADTDFGTMLAARREAVASLILFRHGSERQPEHQARRLLANLPAIENDLMKGSMVVVDPGRIRVRRLPLPRVMAPGACRWQTVSPDMSPAWQI
jgi:predicted nuclease of predicted toxin-antitoxin system